MEVLIAAAAGLLAGHALDLLYSRLFREEPLGGPLYRCAKCRKRLRPVFLVPLLGYALARGRCTDCGEALPMSAVILPLGGAALAIASYYAYDESIAGGVLGGIFGAVFLTLTVTDLERRLLPNRLVYPSILLAIAVSWAWPDSSVTDILAGGLVAIAIAAALLALSLPFGPGAFGMGDVKMIVLIGFVVGFPSVLVAIFVGTIAASVVALALIFTGTRKRTDYMPHGPFLAFGAIIAILWGEAIWDAYSN